MTATHSPRPTRATTDPRQAPSLEPRQESGASLIRCRGCDNRWSGLSAAHCPTCHRTFSTSGNFSRHRRNGACLDPTTVGLVPAERPWGELWMRPGSDERAEAFDGR